MKPKRINLYMQGSSCVTACMLASKNEENIVTENGREMHICMEIQFL